MATRHLDNLKALEVRGTWRYLRTQSASFWLICSYLFLEYVRPQSIWPSIDVLPFAQTSILLSVGALLIEGKKLAIPTVAGSSLLLFTSVLLLSSVTAYRPAVALENLEVYLVWLLVIILIINIVTTESRFLVFMLLFLLSSFKMSQFAFRGFLLSGGSFRPSGATGAPGWFFNSGEFGIQMCVFLPLSMAFLWSLRDRWPRWKQVAMASLPVSAVVSIVASSSRGAMVGIGVVALWWMFAVNRRHRIRGLIAVAVVAVATVAIVPEGSRDRFSDIGGDETSTARQLRWQQGIEMVQQYPVLGVGYANWSEYHIDHYQRGDSSRLSHNIFIQVWAELGYAGLLAFLFMIWAKFKVNGHTRRLARKTPGDHRFSYAMAFGLDGAMIGYLASGFFITVFYYPYFWFNLAMTIALNRAMVRNAREDRRANSSTALRCPGQVTRDQSPVESRA